MRKSSFISSLLAMAASVALAAVPDIMRASMGKHMITSTGGRGLRPVGGGRSRSRFPGEPGVSGNKLARKAAERRLTGAQHPR